MESFSDSQIMHGDYEPPDLATVGVRTTSGFRNPRYSRFGNLRYGCQFFFARRQYEHRIDSYT